MYLVANFRLDPDSFCFVVYSSSLFWTKKHTEDLFAYLLGVESPFNIEIIVLQNGRIEMMHNT